MGEPPVPLAGQPQRAHAVPTVQDQAALVYLYPELCDNRDINQRAAECPWGRGLWRGSGGGVQAAMQTASSAMYRQSRQHCQSPDSSVGRASDF